MGKTVRMTPSTLKRAALEATADRFARGDPMPDAARTRPRTKGKRALLRRDFLDRLDRDPIRCVRVGTRDDGTPIHRMVFPYFEAMIRSRKTTRQKT